MWQRTFAVMSVLVVMLLVAAGCGDDDDDNDDAAGSPAAGGGTTVNVTLTEFAIDMPDELAAGPVTFTIRNNGAEEHNFEIEGQGIEEELENNLQPGESATLDVTLIAGEYKVYCPVEGHEAAGMTKEVTVQ